MRLWLDDVRKMPGTYTHHAYSVDAAKIMIMSAEKAGDTIEIISCDHDLGTYAEYGGDGIKLLDWLEETGRNYPINIHSMNPVGMQNMRRVIERNHWQEIYTQ